MALRILCLGSILDWEDEMWLVLGGPRFLVMESFEGFGNVFWHQDVDFSIFIVPINGESKVACSVPFFADCVVFLEGIHQVLGMLLANVFHAKVVHDKAETYGAPIVLPESWANLALAVPLCTESFL